MQYTERPWWNTCWCNFRNCCFNPSCRVRAVCVCSTSLQDTREQLSWKMYALMSEDITCYIDLRKCHKSVFHLEKWTRRGKIILRENLGGGGGLNFRPSEIASGAFFRPFVAFKWHDEMTIFLVPIRPIQVTLVLIRYLGAIGGQWHHQQIILFCIATSTTSAESIIMSWLATALVVSTKWMCTVIKYWYWYDCYMVNKW